MNIINIDDFLYTKQLNLDLVKIKNSSYMLYELIIKNFGDGRKDYDDHSTMTTELYNSYSTFLYPFPQFYELFTEIKTLFND